jgi:putative FmdB family regulatory protein
MPIFEYMCAECGHKFEKLVLSASREREIQCPECASKSVNEAISVFGLGSSASSLNLGSSSNCTTSL